jgi:hypothetical protein
LEDSRVVARGDDASKVARTNDATCRGVNAAARANQGIQVADWVGEVWMIECVEKISSKFEFAALLPFSACRSVAALSQKEKRGGTS